MSKAVGICKAYLIRWRYNPETKKCEEFVYGGCRGNSNNFEHEEDCLAVCRGKKNISLILKINTSSLQMFDVHYTFTADIYYSSKLAFLICTYLNCLCS